ncbi:GntR family transcriptional regulator [Dethiothermospora halolimnae]|uniref:GntR family transcriptional regulator n=1 Tax=Dethiothermospora halolimnae TaxID=3114390 RepID=UPI003CCB9AA8
MDSDLNNLNLHDYKPLREIVFESLRQAIIEGDLRPGERVMEVQLAEKLGVSRTPVREAIRKLELEGLLVMVPRKGAYVADVSFKDVLNVIEVRASLEGLAASLSAERMTEEEIEKLKEKGKEFNKCLKENDTDGMIQKDVEFHDIIFQGTRNDRLVSIVESLRDQIHRFRVAYIREYEQSHNLETEHEKIIEAICKRDTKKAREHAQYHIENAENYIVAKAEAKLNKGKNKG